MSSSKANPASSSNNGPTRANHNGSASSPAHSHCHSSSSKSSSSSSSGSSSSSSMRVPVDDAAVCLVSEAEYRLNQILESLQQKHQFNIFESQEMTEKRKSIVRDVQKLATQWIQSCLDNEANISQSDIERCSCYILPFGSYELNAHFESSDIDILCVGPRQITRDMLFTQFVQILQEDERIDNILQLRHAFVPLLKFTFCGVDIDMVYAQWNVDIIDIDDAEKCCCGETKGIDIFSKNYIKDQYTLFSINGVRSTQTIKKLIPNKRVFEKTLRIIKFWARQRSIYSNVMGFLGGISWSIMTALICIEHPESNVVEMIKQFFKTYKDNDSDSCIEIDSELYADLYDNKPAHDNEYKRSQYNEIMPILTPARPAMNCAYNVIETTKEVILYELQRAYRITHPPPDSDYDDIDWNQLFADKRLNDPDLFINTQPEGHQIDTDKEEAGSSSSSSAHSDDEDDDSMISVWIRIECIHDHNKTYGKKWSSFIESKIRNLVKKLHFAVISNAQFYPFASSIETQHATNFFIVGKYNPDYDNERITNAMKQFEQQIDHSAVRFETGGKCRLSWVMYYDQDIPDLLNQLEYESRHRPNHANLIPPSHSLPVPLPSHAPPHRLDAHSAAAAMWPTAAGFTPFLLQPHLINAAQTGANPSAHNAPPFVVAGFHPHGLPPHAAPAPPPGPPGPMQPPRHNNHRHRNGHGRRNHMNHPRNGRGHHRGSHYQRPPRPPNHGYQARAQSAMQQPPYPNLPPFGNNNNHNHYVFTTESATYKNNNNNNANNHGNRNHQHHHHHHHSHNNNNNNNNNNSNNNVARSSSNTMSTATESVVDSQTPSVMDKTENDSNAKNNIVNNNNSNSSGNLSNAKKRRNRSRKQHAEQKGNDTDGDKDRGDSDSNESSETGNTLSSNESVSHQSLASNGNVASSNSTGSTQYTVPESHRNLIMPCFLPNVQQFAFYNYKAPSPFVSNAQQNGQNNYGLSNQNALNGNMNNANFNDNGNGNNSNPHNNNNNNNNVKYGLLHPTLYSYPYAYAVPFPYAYQPAYAHGVNAPGVYQQPIVWLGIVPLHGEHV